MQRAVVDFPEPDLTTCGGITPFMKVARLAEAHGLPVILHGAHDLHIHLLAASPNAAYLEWHAFGLDRFMATPCRTDVQDQNSGPKAKNGFNFSKKVLRANTK